MLKFILVAFVCLGSGCATVLTGPKQRISVKSEPSGAEVFVSDVLIDTTPCVIKVKRNFRTSPQIEVRKKGYQNAELSFKRKFNEKAILNFIIIPGWVIDALTGSIVAYTPQDHKVVLKPSKKKGG